MPEFTIFIPVVPEPQKRHRSRIAGSAGKQFVQTYKDGKQRTAEDNLREMLYRELPTDTLFPIQTAIELHVYAMMPPPRSASNVKRKRMTDGEIKHTTKPDVSNLLKHFEDVALKVLYLDDKQIWRATIQKRYSESPGWQVTVRY